MWLSNPKTIKVKAEQLLSNTFGSSVLLSNGRTIANRSHIYRFTVVDDLPNLTKGIIVLFLL